MKTKIVAGNWKMNMDRTSGYELIASIIGQFKQEGMEQAGEQIRMVICPPFFLLHECSTLTAPIPNVFCGAQNCHSNDQGAFTGELSAPMIKNEGAKYVIIGHSERRNYFNESHEFLAKKTLNALAHSLTPIFCCGEVLSERESGQHFETVEKQINESLFSLSSEAFSKVIIAYEPVWAIGTGLTATPDQAQEIHAFIRQLIETKYGNSIADATPLLYGGSCNAGNALELFKQKDVDGGLIGGASLKPDDFIGIVRSAIKAC